MALGDENSLAGTTKAHKNILHPQVMVDF